MSIFVPQRCFDPSIPEMIDSPHSNPKIMQDDLKNLRVINRFFGGFSAVLLPLHQLILKMDNQTEINILDLATGSADIPVAIAKFLTKKERKFKIIAVDKNPQILEIAREQTKEYPDIQIDEQDILHLPYEAASFDIVICSLAIHHFTTEDAQIILNQMNAICKVGLIVNDLNRSWLAAWTAWLYTHITTRNPMTLHDSYLSVLRAFTEPELSELAANAGIEIFTIKKRPFFRLILVG